MSRDLAALMQRVLSPECPGIHGVLELVPQDCDVTQAWVRLLDAGILAPHWPRDPTRCFARVCTCCAGEGAVEGVDHSGPASSTGWWVCSVCTRGAESVEPDLPTVVSLAADAGGLEQAVACARAALARRAPWYPGDVSTTEIRLHPVRPRRGFWISAALDSRPPAQAVLTALRVALGAEGEHEWARVRAEALACVREPDETHAAAANDAAGERLWALCAERGIEPFAGRESPFAPLLALWQRGYALEGTARDIAVLLVRERVPAWLSEWRSAATTSSGN